MIPGHQTEHLDIFVCPDDHHEFFAMFLSGNRLALQCDFHIKVDYPLYKLLPTNIELCSILLFPTLPTLTCNWEQSFFPAKPELCVTALCCCLFGVTSATSSTLLLLDLRFSVPVYTAWKLTQSNPEAQKVEDTLCHSALTVLLASSPQLSTINKKRCF